MRNVVTALFMALSCMTAFHGIAGADVMLEPFTYREDFETRELSAWASYPQWQDTAYDPNMRVNTIVPGDPNISIVQTVTPYTNVDNYAGALKELDMYMRPGSEISLRFYLKTNLPVEFFKIRLAAGKDGKLDTTIVNPPTKRWEWITVDYNDFIRENPRIAGKDKFKVNALAVLAKIPDADPAMPIYLGVGDVVVKGARAVAFKFAEPKMFKLSEWKPYIPQNHYRKGDTFKLSGNWAVSADKVTLDVSLFTDSGKKVLSTNLKQKNDTWNLKPLKLSFDEGLYHATLTAYSGNDKLSDTEFTLYIVPEIAKGSHPRIWFDSEKKKWVDERLKSEKFKSIYDGFPKSANSSRESTPRDRVIFDIDQFPDEKWLIGDGS